jgi:hypothetical protein
MNETWEIGFKNLDILTINRLKSIYWFFRIQFFFDKSKYESESDSNLSGSLL